MTSKSKATIRTRASKRRWLFNRANLSTGAHCAGFFMPGSGVWQHRIPSVILRGGFQPVVAVTATRTFSSVAPRERQILCSYSNFAPDILTAMNREHGFTLIETLVAMTLVLILCVSGLYGWQSWQQSQRLWQSASALREYMLYLRNDANWHNIDRRVRVNRAAQHWCLVADDAVLNDCPSGNPAIFRPLWPEIMVSNITPNLAFFGLRNTAWAGSITLSNASGSWSVVVSGWGRVRLCEAATC